MVGNQKKHDFTLKNIPKQCFWVKNDVILKLHQQCTKSAPKVHQKCTTKLTKFVHNYTINAQII